MKNLIIYFLALSIIFTSKSDSLSKNELIGKWIEVGRLCNIKGVCKMIPPIPQQYDFKSDGIVYVDNVKMYYTDKDGILKISEEKNSDEFMMESKYYFLSEDTLLIESDFDIDNEKIYYKFKKIL